MRHSWAWRLWLLALVALIGCWPGLAVAQTLEAPVGGAAIPVGAGLVACAPAGGWALEAGGAQLRPNLF